jgi:hypothetical protein
LKKEGGGSVNEFVAESREYSGSLSIRAAIEPVFELFSPVGERAWVPGWSPELLHPPDVSWAQGQIFRTRDATGEAVWVVSRLDRDAHEVEYHRVEPQRHVARVRVKCAASSGTVTSVVVSYSFVGLSREGNDEILAMTADAYAGKLGRWQRWIDAYLGTATIRN